MEKYSNILKYSGITSILLGSLCILYSYSLKNRKYCAICGMIPPCFIYRNCNPIRIEGHILKFLENKGLI